MPWGRAGDGVELDANTMTEPDVSSGGFREGSASAGCGGSIIIIRYFQSLSTRQVNESPFPNALGYLPPLKRGDRGAWGCYGRERNDETCRVLRLAGTAAASREEPFGDWAGGCPRLRLTPTLCYYARHENDNSALHQPPLSRCD